MKYLKLAIHFIVLMIYTIFGVPQLLMQAITQWVHKKFMRWEMILFSKYIMGKPIIRTIYLLPQVLCSFIWHIAYLINYIFTWALFNYNKPFTYLFKVLR